MNDDRLRELLRATAATPPGFEECVRSSPRRARVRATVPAALGMLVAVAAVVVLIARPRPVPLSQSASYANLTLDAVATPEVPGPDVLEGQRIADGILAIRTSEVKP